MVDRIIQVNKFAHLCKKRNLKCIVMSIYVKNVFNTLKWKTILSEAKYRQLTFKLMRLLHESKDKEVGSKVNEREIKKKIFLVIVKQVMYKT